MEFIVDINVNDNSPIKQDEDFAAFIFMPEVNVKDYENNPSEFRRLLKERASKKLNG